MSNEKDKLFSAVCEYRTARKKACDEYDAALKAAGRCKDSVDSARANLKEQIDACKAEYSPKLHSIVKNLRDQVVRVSLHVPTDEQLKLLKVMAMQPVLFEDILIRAAQKLSSSPLALEALRGIVVEKNARWPFPEVSGTFCTLTGARTICDTLNDRITNYLAYMERVDDGTQSANASTKLNTYDKDFDSADDCFQAFAGVNEAQSKAFFEFLSRKDALEINVNY